jgi:2-keto-4-pentenoate hydratase/2-oxohepta-3-ene-1,7-dioic acid hydratase in catechol pathway
VKAAAIAGVLALACGGTPPSAPGLEETSVWGEVAAPEEALTFARRAGARGAELLLVRGVTGEQVEAVVVPGADDPIAALASPGREALRAAVMTGPSVQVPLEELRLPLDLGDRHVAAGTNFREHGDEVGIEEPFLFPKLVAPTPWASDVGHVARLDYEVELCFTALRPIAAAEDLEGAFGLLLCNDFTDRWKLVKGMLSPGEMGTRGFADGKGGAGSLPVGPFLVVPEDLDGYLKGVSLELFVNGTLRQRAPASDMIWPLEEIVSRALADDRLYRHAEGDVTLLEGETLPSRTLVLSGTPGGVLFRFGHFWRDRAYLQPEDIVIARATGLGVLRSRIVTEAH